MNVIRKTLKNLGLGLALPVLIGAAPTLAAKAYTPFAASLPAKLLTVKSASVIQVEAETWPGFKRSFDISLADIQLPQNAPTASLCERKLADKALTFVRDFLSGADRIEIKDMTMENSAQQEAEADVVTDKGSLVQALLDNGLARSAEADPSSSWCR